MDTQPFHNLTHIFHESLTIQQIRTDHLADPMTTLSDQDVFSFAEKLQNAYSLPSVTVFFDGQYYWLAQASIPVFQLYLFAGLPSILSKIEQGNQADAIDFLADAEVPD